MHPNCAQVYLIRGMLRSMGAPTFLDTIGAEPLEPDDLPPPPITKAVKEESRREASAGMKAQEKYGHLMETIPSPLWNDDWVRLVMAAEEEKGRAVCGARRDAAVLKEQVNTGNLSYEDIDEDPVLLVCKSPAGFKTEHPGEGRCVSHGGNLSNSTTKTGRFSLLKHNKLAPRVDEYFESEQLTDLRSSIGIIYAALDEAMGDDKEITLETAETIAGLMSKVGTLTKQHNDITASKQITIEVPEFMAWAEFFYELAIKYIDEGDGNVAGFLGEAQAFFNATVSLTLGPVVPPASSEAGGDSAGALGSGSGVEVVGVPRTGVEVT